MLNGRQLPGWLCVLAITFHAHGAADHGDTIITAPAPGHSVHGEAFNEGPRAAAVLLPGMPKVHFPIRSAHPDAQAFFDQGVGQLHGFWYFEAERSFRQVAQLDPQCAMAYWGMAMANVNNPARARDFIARAVALKPSATEREQRWIDALAEYRRDKDGDNDRPEKDRRRAYVRALESLVQDFPEDIEAKAFLVYQVWDNAGFGNEKPLAITSHQAVDALLDQVFRADPMHPAHHYRIHLWDSEKPVRALGSAAQGGPSGPGIAHLWHMPGHTYDKLRRFADAAWQQEASARVDHAHMRRARILPDQIFNYAHNQEWLARSLSHLGRVKDSLAVARNLAELPRHPKWNDLAKGNGSASQGRRRLAETLVRWELWDEAIREAERGLLEPAEPREHAVLRHFTLGLARLLKTGQTNSLADSLTALENLRAAAALERVQAADDAAEAARKAKKDREAIGRAMADALLSQEAGVLRVDEALAELRGWQAAFAQDRARVGELFEQARKTPKTRLAYAWLRAGDPEEAVKAALAAAETATNQLHELAVRCDVLWQAGKTQEALEAMAAVRQAASHADLDLPVLRRLRPVADALGLPEDWREPAATPSDLGDRPPLETLGPRFWEPYEAPAWRFARAEGGFLESAEFAGRAYLMLFYLGHGCSHCVEQLRTFGPMTQAYSDAGVQVLAVSLDAPQDLGWTAHRAGTAGRMDFPVLSDEDRMGFKAFGAFDDFEQIPMHGAFLVDGAGRVRWQDIGPEPFTDAKFLLAEAKRLLGVNRPLAMAR